MTTVTITGVGGRQITVPTGLFIDNKFVAAHDNATVQIDNPFNGNTLAHVSAAQASDVDKAVTAAEKAFKGTWKSTQPTVRRNLLNRLADLIERDIQDLASLESVDAGILYRDSSTLFIPQAVETLRYYAGWADKVDGQSLHIPQGISYSRRIPFGVCAAIVPWNAPLMITIWKLAAALATGNVLIIKTPEASPLYGQKLAELIAEAGFPPGVVSILCGLGTVAGSAISAHPTIRKLSFTGSPAVGRQILAVSAKTNLKKIGLELGGKGPSIVFDDANFENALQWTSAGITMNNGQICAAGSRIYVHANIYDKFVKAFSEQTKDAIAGDPLLQETTKGPVINGGHKKRVMDYIKKGQDEKVQVLHGADDSKLPAEGHFVPNTAFVDVDPQATVIREEIFGPVACIVKFSTEEEVVRLANDSCFGLASAVFTQDINRAIRVSEELESGQVTINMWGAVNANVAFGGCKESGFGRDLGKEAIEDWTQAKYIQVMVPKL
ncbi:aldehyde dehydrogenase [Fusarium sporotrichioides]|uniref:aldehyde dehydrogenase (NAD(+)) n=1 Tax=Fusarium sporotrichioides TaxID=5514 RepID=A0A395S0V8_FUSSP|nr:aldehyde dehydrogenase [Fusarium sporotrichioides]